MALCIDTEKLVRDSADRSIREVFSMMIGEDLTQVEADDAPGTVKKASDRVASMTVLLGFTGDIQGSLSLTLCEPAAIACTRALIDHETDAVDQTVIDAVGELGNMVVGGVKRRMAGSNMTMSLPTVIRTDESTIVFPTNTIPIRVKYEYLGYLITFVIAIRNQ